MGAVDTELRGQTDFRDISWEVCLGADRCNVDGIEVVAERLNAEGVWISAAIYWDPIDGLGVLDGHENDEIDINERLTIRFAAPMLLRGLWLSDLFIGEGARFEGWEPDPDDVEVAFITLSEGGYLAEEFRVSGVFDLPDSSFNASVVGSFGADGEAVGAPLEVDGQTQVTGPDNVAERLPTLADLPWHENALQRFAPGGEKADRIGVVRPGADHLAALRAMAEERREVGDISNGELGWTAPQPRLVDQIVLSAGDYTSSDYSISGIVAAPLMQLSENF